MITPSTEHPSQKGKPIIIVAPSGTGKTTIIKKLMTEIPQLSFSVSATTRKPREGESDGVDYFFLTHSSFEKKIQNDEFLEWEEFYGGNKYGTLYSAVENQLDKGYFCLLDIEVKGAVNVKSKYGDQALSIFIKPPSLQVLKERLINRGTETPESLALRLERAEMELQLESKFDYTVINDNLDLAYSQVKQLIQTFINEH